MDIAWQGKRVTFIFNAAAYEEIMLEAGLNRFIMWLSIGYPAQIQRELQQKRDDMAVHTHIKILRLNLQAGCLHNSNYQSLFRFIAVYPQEITCMGVYVNAVMAIPIDSTKIGYIIQIRGRTQKSNFRPLSNYFTYLISDFEFTQNLKRSQVIGYLLLFYFFGIL